MKTPETSLSLPQGFAEEMRALGGIDAEALFRALESAPETGVRLNSRKLSSVSFPGAEPVNWCPVGLHLPERPVFTLMPQLHAGAFYVQDPSSMIHREIVSRLVSGPSVLVDFCASPGGKTTAAIDALPDGSVVIANEFEPSRVGALKENIVKWGCPHVAVTNSSTAAFRSLAGCVDIALVDAPCSGEGMMRKDVDARRQWTDGLVARCAALQREIVADAVESLKPGGCLIYSTCTFNRTENEDMLDFMADEFGLESVDLRFPAEWGILPGLSDRSACRFMPHATRGEGLFVAVMRKPDGLPAREPRRQKPVRLKTAVPGTDLLERPGDFEFSLQGNVVKAVKPQLSSLLSMLPKRTKTVACGVEIGEQKGRDFIPSAALALSTAYRRGAFPEVELAEDEVLAYLRRDVLTLPSDAPRGICLVCYDGLPLGWVKNLGNRANNLYPQAWKIRMNVQN